MGARVDRARLALGLLCLGAMALPFVTVRPSRIGQPRPVPLSELVGPAGLVLCALLALALLGGLVLSRRPGARVALALAGVAAVLLGVGQAASVLAAATGPYARVSPGAGAWTLLGLLGLFFTDAASRLPLGATGKLLLGAGVLAGLVLLLASPPLAALSLMVEYRNRATSFWTAGAQHLLLAGGSFAAALAIGVPLGLVAARSRRIAGPLLGALTAVQTVPSIAMFGLMIVPLGWVAAHVPLAADLGVRGIGMAPALAALFLYALLPVVGNTVAGLRGVAPATLEAASAMGLDPRQRLWRVEVPLALPVILTGARIVLVQNIGLATVGALIGAGGFGAFVFQGIGQTATDLVLLGALPPVALAALAALIMNALIARVPGSGA
ncbi:MAG: ABC transporter permease [Rhodovulum sulfidophilum]|uniref:ABC transporter permease n=1 Tax=Rhodovulum sulfidophilum TaxID=35806 RepID=A0A2W5NCG9_RHOSU|nr:MAG: ABC transporter permease [Rhodovulum sulfidophilum]